MDTVGSFSNNLIAVTSSETSTNALKGVWEVDAHSNPTLLTHIDATLLEGAVVVRTNFGPWSRQIMTGDEITGNLFTINTNGALTTIASTNLFPNGINSESIQVIPPNQSLYVCDVGGAITKLPKSYFTNYAGDLLIEDGEVNRAFLIIHWDSVGSNFITRRIRYTLPNNIEHCVFAPIELPAQ